MASSRAGVVLDVDATVADRQALDPGAVLGHLFGFLDFRFVFPEFFAVGRVDGEDVLLGGDHVHHAFVDEGSALLLEDAGLAFEERLAVGGLPGEMEFGGVRGVDLAQRREAGVLDVAADGGPVGAGAFGQLFALGLADFLSAAG